MEGDTGDLWVEMKYLKELPKRGTTQIDLCHPRFLSKLQQLWLDRRNNRHHDAVVILGHPEGCAVFREGTWKEPLSVTELLAKTIPLKIATQQLCNSIST